jgi:glutamate synthase domain-containing protein 2
MMLMSLDWATQRLINLHNAWRTQVVDVLAAIGLPSIQALRGRTEFLSYVAASEVAK